MAIIGAAHLLKVYMADDLHYLHIKEDATDTTKITMVMKNTASGLAVSDKSVNIPTLTADTISCAGDATADNFIGQLLTFHGETDGTLTNFPFVYGSNENSTSIFGMVCPIACECVRYSFATTNSYGNTAYTTSSVIVFRLWQNNSAKDCYAFIDFSNTTNGSIGNRRFTNKFSSSGTEQIDIDSFDLGTGSSGVPFNWKVFSTTETTQTGHRFITMVQTTEGISKNNSFFIQL